MSYYRDCANAIRELVADRSLHARAHRGFFTNLDVVALVDRRRGGLAPAQVPIVMREASNALQKAYQGGTVARYGPVRLPHNLGRDYARIATRIVHAAPAGAETFRTPNGNFKRLTIDHERTSLRQSGRRWYAVRDDRKSWSSQPEFELAVLKARLDTKAKLLA